MVIGVVGKMASGKSTVCHYLKSMIEDAEIIDIDSVAKEIYRENPGVVNDLKNFFGDTICFPEGDLNYNELALKVFSSQKNLKKINSIMFPEIKMRTEILLEEKGHRNCLIIDAAVLFGAELYRFCDYVIWVRAERDRCFRLLKETCRLSDDDLKTRIDGQVINIIENQVDFIVDNNGTLHDLKDSVKKIADRIKTGGHIK